MNTKRTLSFLNFFLAFVLILCIFSLHGCARNQEVTSASGVKLASTQVQTDSNGETVEQRNIKERLARDNKPGSTKFLYIVSPFTGDLILSSTITGKVTSSSKRLTPSDLERVNSVGESSYKYVTINGERYTTDQNLGDDGTYGDSIQYLYWFDVNGVYHQAYVSSAIVHISDQPQNFYKTTQKVDSRK